jgi:hypothetical protein
MHDHRQDIDDASRLAGFCQVANHALHQQERSGHIGSEHSVEELGSGIQKRASIG